MNCQNCGSVLPRDAVRCDVCGVKVPKKGPGAAAHRIKMICIGAGVGLIVVGAFVVPAFMNSASAESAGQSARVASDLVTQNELIVPVQVSGLDASGSRIPVHVKGLTSGGTAVEQDGFVNNEGKGLTLEQGMYEVTAIGSPISSSGVLYNLPATGVSVEVSAEGGSSYTMSASLTLAPVDAASVTDEQIEAARQWILKDPERSVLADQLAEAARQRRAAAQKAHDGTKNENNQKQEKQEGSETQSDQSDQSGQSGQSGQASGQSSDSSGDSSDGSGQSNDSNYSYYGGNYDNTQSYYGGNAAQSNTDSGAASQTQGGDAQPADSSQDGGQQGGEQGGQQADATSSDTSSGGGSESGDTGGSGSEQGSSSAQPSDSGTNANGASGTTPTA